MMNYENAFTKMKVLSAYKNSFIISGSVTLGVMLFSALMSLGLSRYHFKGNKVIQSLVVASLMFPVFSTIIPVFRMMVSWKLLNNNLAVILPQIAGNLSFATIVMKGFMDSIPIEMEEAAYMEGANVFQVFRKIIVPLCKPSLSTVAIFSFMWSYNDLFVQKVMISDKTKFPVSTLLEENQLSLRNRLWFDGSIRNNHCSSCSNCIHFLTEEYHQGIDSRCSKRLEYIYQN